MDKYELAEHQHVIDLAAIQAETGLNDTDFARRVKLVLSASSWGKVKAGTYAGNCTKALAAVAQALQDYHLSELEVKTWEGMAVLNHMQLAQDAVQIARCAQDEHRLVIVSGYSGAGKTVTGAYLHALYGGSRLNARPSWSRGYLQTLTELAAGLGIGGSWHNAGKAESDILRALASSPRLIIIDEANHFSKDALNFLKTILNETRCCLVLLTLPTHLAAIGATHAEETRQLVRRSVANIIIPGVGEQDVKALCSLYQGIDYNAEFVSVASLANRYSRLDTVRGVLDMVGEGQHVSMAIKAVEQKQKTVINSNK